MARAPHMCPLKTLPISLEVIAEIVEQDDVPGSWGVEVRRNGEFVSLAIFGGTGAKRRATGYARENYALVLPARTRKTSALPPETEIATLE